MIFGVNNCYKLEALEWEAQEPFFSFWSKERSQNVHLLVSILLIGLQSELNLYKQSLGQAEIRV